jgi:hypothetical protein
MNPNSSQESVESNSARKRRLAREFNEARTAQAAPQTLTRAEREELNALSKEVFGASSRWQKLVTNGYSELVTQQVIEEVPAEKAGDAPTTREVTAPLLRADGARQSVTKYHTVESIRAYMVERKAKIEEIRAAIKKQQEEARAKKAQEELALKVHNELQGAAT